MKKNMEAVQGVHEIIVELEKLLQASFGGAESKRVRQMVNDVAFLEHEADIMQRVILKKLYNMEDKLSYTSFALWMNLISRIASLGNVAEKLAYKISSLIETS
jgi:hypothetical protein